MGFPTFRNPFSFAETGFLGGEKPASAPTGAKWVLLFLFFETRLAFGENGFLGVSVGFLLLLFAKLGTWTDGACLSWGVREKTQGL